ncbi:ATP-binding protein [Rhizobium sp. FKL33]|uniref:sensor histidine kinase n=1 Tax=Rhizobium sp. FKL33 TaxID=2562307 RepID=UPI0010C0467E|nr:ATP-binding protein [Rhizobium sp. FKL33]
MKRYLPKALHAWLLIILVAGLASLQIAFLRILASDRAESNETAELYRVNERATWLVKLLAAAPESERRKLAASLDTASFVVNMSTSALVPSPIASNDTLAELEDILVSRLGRYGVADARVRLDRPDHPVPPPQPQKTAGKEELGEVESDLASLASDFQTTERYAVSLQFRDGQWVNFVSPVTPLPPILSPNSLPTYIIAALVVIAISLWAVWRLASPYILLEQAVNRLGRDLRSPPLPETGAADYRAAARAINAMQRQLVVYVEDREHLAAALAHDLRTPLTRMRLRLETMRKSDLRDALARDIAAVDRIAASVLDFSRAQNIDGDFETIDLAAFVETLADDYPEVEMAEPPEGRILCRVEPEALRRCLRNLIENGVKYGGAVILSLSVEDDAVSILIDDDGPGIAEDQLEAVFQPFRRLEGSRNPSTGGFGLGLAIARGLARKLGGEITLANRPEGGLRARFSLARSAG